jgi:hypothetical protein
MNPAELQQPILDGGIRSINFFNGRLLTARDLTREQAANREVDKRLGRGVGDGIAYGFEVSKSSQGTNALPVLTVEPGLAINRRGQTLQLATQIDVGLVRQSNGSAGATPAFSECTPIQAGTYVAGAGVYLLTVAPAETSEGLAVTAGLETGIASCNRDTLVSGLQFRLIQLNPPVTAAELHDENHLRNLVAYKCFGAAETNSFVADLFGPELKQYGLLDSLRPNRLTDCDVPLGVLYWTLSDGLKFVDMWSVRRRLAAPSASPRWLALISDRRASEGEARFMQFEAQLDDLRRDPFTAITIRARDYFRNLPAAGLLPISRSPVQLGFNESNFFDGLTTRGVVRDANTDPIIIEAAQVESILRHSLAYPPHDLASGVMLWVYHVRENVQAVEQQNKQSYLLFTSGHMPYFGDARFNVNRWSLSNFALWLDSRGE